MTQGARGQGLFQGHNHVKSASGWGMGAAVSSLNNNPDGVFLNPASLARSPEFFHLNYTRFVLDINTTSLGVGLENKYFHYAINISYLNYGDFEEKDENGLDFGSFSAHDKEIALVVARRIGRYVSAGLSTAFIGSTIQNYSASALTGGLGLQYFHPEHEFAVGISYRNIDYQLSGYTDKKENMPNLAIVGLSKKLQYLPATVSLDIMAYQKSNIIFNTGIKFQPNAMFRLFLGTGSRKFDLQNRTNLNSLLSGISFGTGFQIKKMNFDISYSSLGDAGQITSFSFYKLLD
ncbi:MAG: hypothetical protein JXQ65_12550 [Candidatus Marinimicrobia bacterium]|nr:hypothetical protein [Candidatus Neomarinimicrobiota bacterium]